jgi:hypothetical protein
MGTILHGILYSITSIFFMKPTQSNKERTTTDLPESKRDKKLLKPDEATLDLPEVKDIPGQEHVRPLPPGEMADTTISSADEEAKELLDTDEDILTDKNLNVTNSERDLLQRSTESMATLDDEQLNISDLDKTDDEGEMLNEGSDRSGRDLDVPGSEDDDADEKIGEEDEENNSYSLPEPEEE